jgi:hypothetical protein
VPRWPRPKRRVTASRLAKPKTAWRNELAGLTLTMLLYLGGEPDLVLIIHPGEKPLNAEIARTDPDRYRDLAEPTVQSVGKAFTRAIEHWEIKHRGDQGVGNDRTCAAPIQTSTGPEQAESSRESNSCYPLAVRSDVLVEDTRVALVR